MAAILCDVWEGDEVILPSFTFVSTATAFALRGARLRFVDIREDKLNLDESRLEALVGERTKVIVPVHYAGVGCKMNRILEIARRHDALVVEDAAQAVDSTYEGRHLGTFGDLGCFSFHETKNYICGEGGALVLNDERFLERAEIVREKGTNRTQFFRGDVDKRALREVMRRELEKDPALARYFDDWGSRAYVFSSELGRDFLRTASEPRVIRDLELDREAMESLGIRFVVSAAEIAEPARSGLAHRRTFVHPDSAWLIHLYELAEAPPTHARRMGTRDGNSSVNHRNPAADTSHQRPACAGEECESP